MDNQDVNNVCYIFSVGHLDVKYKLQSNRDAEVFRTITRNLANGQLHTISIRRQAENLYIQVGAYN